MDRKTLYDISWQVTEDEYRADPAYSYSTIARFNREGFNNIEKLYEKVESPSLLFGSMVDTLLTDSKEEFERKFEIAEFPSISDNLIQVTRNLFNLCHESYRNLDLIPEETIAQVGEECGYYANPKYKSFRIKKIREECAEYYNLLYLAMNKILVSNEDYQKAEKCVDTLKNSEATKWYFAINNPFEPIERFYQLKFKGTWDGYPLKIMADLIIVNHKDKTIIPCDLKTSSKREWEFPKSFIKWNYWIQAQLYWYIIKQNLLQSEEYKDYKLWDYRFIVVNKDSLQPLVWSYKDTTAEVDCCYGPDKQYKCKNWRDIVIEMDYYLKHNPVHPLGITTTAANSIIEWLEYE